MFFVWRVVACQRAPLLVWLVGFCLGVRALRMTELYRVAGAGNVMLREMKNVIVDCW